MAILDVEMVKLILSFEKKHLGFLLLGIGIFVFAGFVWAYDPTFVDGVGVPAAFGHSADELMVSVGGNQKTLQEAINDGSLGAPSGDPGVDLWLAGQSGAIYYNGGNVGIGTQTPSGLLHLYSSSNGRYIFTGSNTGGYATTFNMDATGLSIGHDSSVRNLALRTNNADRLVIGGTGAVSLPSGVLDLGSGIAQINLGTGADVIFDLLVDSGTAGSDYLFKGAGTSTTDIFTIDGTDGDVNIVGDLDVGGTLTASNIDFSPADFDASSSLGALVIAVAAGFRCDTACPTHGLVCAAAYTTLGGNPSTCTSTSGGRLCLCH